MCTSKSGTSFIGTYVSWLHKLRWCILPVSLAMMVVGLMGFSQLFNVTTNYLAVTGGTRSADNVDKMNYYYPSDNSDVKWLQPESLLIETLDGTSLLPDDLLRNVTDIVENYWGGNSLIKIASYYGYVSAGLTLQASMMINTNESASLIQVTFANSLDDQIVSGEAAVVAEIQAAYPNQLYTGFTGQYSASAESSDETEKEIMSSDVIVIPLSFVVLAVVLQSWRLILLPLVSVLMTAGVAGGVMWVIAKYWLDVSSATPSMMMFLEIGVSIDYSLFLLTRFREERLVFKRETAQAVEQVLLHSGHVILGSGSTLCLCFIGLLFLPVESFQTLGLGAILVVICAILFNLTLVPALLLTFPRFFGVFGCWGISRWFKCCTSRIPTPKLPLWFRYARLTTKWQASVCAGIVFLALGISMGIVASDLTTSPDLTLMQPDGLQTTETLDKIQTSFSPGMSAPYTMLYASKTGAVIEENFWNAALDFQQTAEAQLLSSQSTASMQSLMYVQQTGQAGVAVTFAQAQFLSNPSCVTAECLSFQRGYNASVNPANTAVTGVLISDQQPTSLESTYFVQDLRALIDQFNSKYSDTLEVAALGLSCQTYDSNEAVMDMFPIVVAITVVVCLLVVGLMFRSVLVPIVSVVTILLTLIIAFGVTVGIYQDGWLEGLDSKTFAVSPNGISWVVVPLCFAIVLGLCLDYNIFLIGRISESRHACYGEKASIQIGVWKTGYVIAMAGIIMGLAFMGLILTSTPLLNQAGVLLVVAVLVDTLLVRPFIAPAAMALFGRFNWWPAKIPDVEHEDSMHLLELERARDCAAPSEDDNTVTGITIVVTDTTPTAGTPPVVVQV